MKCDLCGGTGTIAGEGWTRTGPCYACSDSGTPWLDYTLDRRYAAGIDKEGNLKRPLHECLKSNGHVKVRAEWAQYGL